MQDADKNGPQLLGTVAILACCVVSYFLSLQDLPPSGIAQGVSYAWLAGMLVSFALDARRGLRNLIRVDVFALLALYFFLYFEFLFPQLQFDLLVIPKDTVTAVQLTLVGLAAMVVGRHIRIGGTAPLAFIGRIEMRNRDYLTIYFGSFILSCLPMWLAVEFDPFKWFEELISPRFGRSWGRGRYGDLSSLLHELQLLGYVMPPIAGVICVKWRAYSKASLMAVALALLLLWFIAFSSGTRNVLGIQLAGFLGGYLVVQHRLKLRIVLPSAGLIGVGFVVLAGMMLEFREIGLKRYIEEGRYRLSYREFEQSYLGGGPGTQERNSYFVDYNLWRISQMVGVFPRVYDHVGWNLPYVALTKPIPRAFWPGKPKDLEVGLEEAIGAKGYTIACSWIGEAYVSGGMFVVIITGLAIGAFCRFWNQLAGYIHSPFALVVFASGFFAVLLLMRSLMFFTTAMLPAAALVLMGAFLYKHRAATLPNSQ